MLQGVSVMQPQPPSGFPHATGMGEELSAEERALIERLRALKCAPKPWLVELVAWVVETQRAASERQPKEWQLRFTGLGGPRLFELIDRGRR